MGIFGLETFVTSNPFNYPQINIRELVAEDSRKVIVVDGNLFIEFYLYKKFPWIVCGLAEYADYVRDFVQKFMNVGIKLVFFFNENCILHNSGTSWQNVHRKNVMASKDLLQQLEKQQPVTPGTVPRNLPNTHDVMCWAISVLQDLNCEVICPLKDRICRIASYARAHDCLAILSQTSYFVFFENLNSTILSLLHFDIENMTTNVYDREVFGRRLRLDSKFYPLLVALLVCNEVNSNPYRRNVLEIISRRVTSFVIGPTIVLTATYIRENYDLRRLEVVPDIIDQHFPLISEMLKDQYYRWVATFSLQIDETQDFLCEVASNSWEKIKGRCKALTYRGKLCGKIRFILEENFFEQFPSLEDFQELPPSSLVYRKLRKNMYGILLHEIPEMIKIQEWCIETEDTPGSAIPVLPTQFDSTLHPGLCALWDDTIQDEGLSDSKWRLFAAVISPELDHRSLRNLPKSLIVPVAVLYYLIQTLPKCTHSDFDAHLHPLEVEVFLVVALTLRDTDINIIRDIPNLNGNVRAVRLANLFTQGCDIAKMAAQSCGLFLEDIDLSIWKYFDGKLFVHLYAEIMSGKEILDLSSQHHVRLSSLQTMLSTARYE